VDQPDGGALSTAFLLWSPPINSPSEGSSCQKSFLAFPALKRAGFEAPARPAAAPATKVVRERAGEIAIYAATFAMAGELGPRASHLLPVPVIGLPVPQSCDCTEWFVSADIRALQGSCAGPIEKCLARLPVSSWISFIGIIPKECAGDLGPPRFAIAKLLNGFFEIVYRPFVRGDEYAYRRRLLRSRFFGNFGIVALTKLKEMINWKMIGLADKYRQDSHTHPHL
jgi:hypothetical protein